MKIYYKECNEGAKEPNEGNKGASHPYGYDEKDDPKDDNK